MEIKRTNHCLVVEGIAAELLKYADPKAIKELTWTIELSNKLL